jgi:hypothetical protein
VPSLAVLAACTSSSGARVVRQTADGGTIIVNGGVGNAGATRQAVSAIEQHCKGVYEVVEVAQVQTGQTPSIGVGFGMGPIGVGTSSSFPVYGSSVTYVCRPPQSTLLNESMIRAASADLVGRSCAKDDDCGPLLCARATPSAATGTCSAPDR